MYVCVFVCVFECWVPQQKKNPVFSPSYSHRAVRLKAYFATCVHVFRTELDREASSGEVTDCVIVSKLNNQYSSTCWDNAIIHLSIVQDCRQRDISHCCLLFEMPYFRNSLSELCKNKSCLIFFLLQSYGKCEKRNDIVLNEEVEYATGFCVHTISQNVAFY